MNRVSVLLTLSLLVLGCSIGRAADSANELLVMVPIKPAAAAATSSPASEPRTVEEAYDRFMRMASIVTLDSPSGPVPAFGNDVVYDKNGFPVPRLPDPFRLAVYANPTSVEALDRYLDWQKAIWRRTRLAMNAPVDRAAERGIVTPETLAVQPNRPSDQKAIGDYHVIEPKSLGTPLLTPAQAREAGVTSDTDNPVLPGKPSPTGIEVYWFWHHRCPICLSMARDWFAFQRAVNAAKHKAVSINLMAANTDNALADATDTLAGVISLWQVRWGDDVEYSRNYLDYTEAAKAFKITGTPVVILINRNAKPVQVERLVGAQSETELRDAFCEIAHLPSGTWPPPAGAQAPAADAAAQQASPAPGTTPLDQLDR